MTMINKVLILVITLGLASCNRNSPQVKTEVQEEIETPATTNSTGGGSPLPARATSFVNAAGQQIEKIYKTERQWREELTDKEYYVLREKGTERAHTSSLLQISSRGDYLCKACKYPLFASDTKYKSGTGWPSFYQPIEEESILSDTDYNLGYARTEVMCNRCESHLGHVFKDGPEPTGLRYCINGVSLQFAPKK